MTTTQYVVATHNLNRTNDAIKVPRRAWISNVLPAAFPRVHVCIQCGYTGDFTHIYNGAHPECPMCEGE